MGDPITLTAGLRVIPPTEPLLNGRAPCDGLILKPQQREPYTETFRAMVRDLAFDVAEMPLVTQALAADAGRPLTAIPVILAGGAPHHASLLCLTSADFHSPADLVGRRIGVRSYAQTTGAWVRGILMHEYGVTPDAMNWVVTEDAHVETFRDPAFVSRTDRTDLLGMLRDGSIDALIASPQVVKNATDIRTVIADAPQVGQEWLQRSGITTINHVVSLRTALVDSTPSLAKRLQECFARARDIADAERAPDTRPFLPYGEVENRASIDLLLQFCHEQGLTRTRRRYGDLFLAWIDDR